MCMIKICKLPLTFSFHLKLFIVGIDVGSARTDASALQERFIYCAKHNQVFKLPMLFWQREGIWIYTA